MKHRKYRVKTGNYYHIYKPHFKDSKNGRVPEHRYIMYLYLSILNNKITYIPRNMDIHHKNKDGLDNRIENLELLSQKDHADKHRDRNGFTDIDNRFCNICHLKSKRNNRDQNTWYYDINGFLCIGCYNTVLYFRKKFGLK